MKSCIRNVFIIFYTQVTTSDKELLTVLRNGIRAVLKKNFRPATEFEELYRNAYIIVLRKQGETLYLELKKTIVQHLNDVRIGRQI